MSTSSAVEETVAFGRRLGATARAGDVFALVGVLGAGKTQLVKGIVAGVGYPGPVTSPTFTLLHEYNGGRLPVYHFDFYRVQTAEEALQLGFDDAVYDEGVAIIEWADRFPSLLPSHACWIRLTPDGEHRRRIEQGTAP
jgi:tRNA threonylcarbamoyladenosine biosynthesis protein TsaE